MYRIYKLAALFSVVAAAGAVIAVGVLLIVGAATPLGRAFSFQGPPEPVHLRPLSTPSKVYDSKGNLIAVLSDSNYRIPVPLSQIPPVVIHAVLDVEDNTFYSSGPVDLRGILRALRTDLLSGGIVQGGSTITQQLVKNAVLTPKRTLGRKLTEAVLSFRLAKQMSKNQILGRYLNTIYFGDGAYGIQAAAHTYFGESVSRLDAAQAALLASLIENPAGYNPIAHPAAARYRRNVAIEQMVQNNDLTPAQAAIAKAKPLPTTLHPFVPPPMSAFVNQVVQNLSANPALGSTRTQRIGALYGGGLKIYTTLNPTLQADAKAAVAARMPPTGGRFTAALVSMDPKTGAVRALISGNPTTPLGFDVATGLGGTGRQAGSSFKIFTLLSALESGINPASTLDGTGPCRINYPGAVPAIIANAEPGYGIMNIYKATADSVNCAYVRLGIYVGLAKVRAMAHRLGVTSYIPKQSPAIVIGSSSVTPLEMATAYSVLANGGILHRAILVDKVVTASNRVLISASTKGQRVVPKNDVAVADRVLQGVIQHGTGTAAALPGRPAAGKTGTTDNFGDAWFDGYTPQLVTSVWVGDPAGQVPMTNVGGITVFGGTYPAMIWHNFMASALASQPVLQFPAPSFTGFRKPSYILPPYAPGTLPPPTTTTTTIPPTTTTTTAPSKVHTSATTTTTSSSTTTTTSSSTTTTTLAKTKVGGKPTA